jgi:hypothetical protein
METGMNHRALALVLIATLAACANPVNRLTMEDYAAACSAAEQAGRMSAAEEACYRAWVNTQLGVLGPQETSTALYNLGRVQKRSLKLPQAEASLKKSLELEEGLSGPTSAKTGRRLAELSAVLLGQQRFVDGAPYMERLIPIASEYQGSERNFVAGLFFVYSEQLRGANPALATRLEQAGTSLGYKRTDFPSA